MLTQQEYQYRKSLIEKAKSRPGADLARLNAMEARLDSVFSASSEPSGQFNMEEDSKNGPPQSIEAPEPARREGVGGYFFNPSVEEFHGAMKDRSARERIGIDENYRSDNAAGREYLESKVPELAALKQTDIEQLGEQSQEYKQYAEYAYKEAQKKDPTLQRYDELSITESPFRKALGAVIKHGPAAALGAEKTIGLGIPRRAAAVIAGNVPDSAADTQYDTMGAPVGEYHSEKAQAITSGVEKLESLSPVANTAGLMGGYLLPQAPANLASRGVQNLLGYEARNPFTKTGIASLVGGIVSAGEGAIQDFTDNPDITLSELGERAIPRAVYGAGGGVIGDIAAQGSAKAQRAIGESPRGVPLKNQRDIGGDTHLLSGVTTSPNVRENVRLGVVGRENRTPQDFAAQRVAPKFKESAELKVDNARKTVEANLEEYLNRPEVASQQESLQPIADGIFAMFKKGVAEGPVTGNILHANPRAVRTFAEVLKNNGEINHLAPEQAALYAKKTGGKMLSEAEAKTLGLPFEQGKIPVYVAVKRNARDLLALEQMIDDELGMANIPGGANKPIWKDINRSVKSVRDKFGIPAPEFHNPGEPFSPASPPPEGAQSLGKPQDVFDQPRPEAEPGIGPFVKDERFMDPGEPFVPHSPTPSIAQDLGKPQDVFDKVRPEAEPGIGPFVKDGRFMDPGNPFRTSDDIVTEEARNLGQPLGVGIDNPKMPEAMPGIGNSPKALNRNPFGRQGAYAMQPDRQVSIGQTQPKNPFKPKIEVEKTITEIPPSLEKPKIEAAKVSKPTDWIAANQEYKKLPEVVQQRLKDVNKFASAQGDHFTKAQIQQKMGLGHQPTWEIDEMVKAGKLERVPPEQKKFSQVDAEYRVPKNQKSTPSPVAKTSATNQPSAREVIEKLGGVGKRIRIADIRNAFPDMSREQLDKMLMEMQDSGEAALYKLDNANELKPEDVKGAMDVAGNQRHVLYLDPRFKKKVSEQPKFIERRQPGRPTDSEWERLSPREKANTPLSEVSEVVTVPPTESEIPEMTSSMIVPSSKPADPTEIAPPIKKKTKFGGDEQYQKDIQSTNRELDFGREERASDNSRASNLRKEFGDYEALNREAEPHVSPYSAEHYQNYRRQKEIEDAAIDAERKANNGVEDISPSEYQSIGPDISPQSTVGSPKTEHAGTGTLPPDAGKAAAQEYAKGYETPPVTPGKMGAESHFDDALLRRQIDDQAKLEGIKSPLAPEEIPNPSADNSVPEATLEDGTKVRGLSAVQRKHHLMLKELDDLEKALGTGTEESAHRAALGYKTGEGRPYKDALMAKEADELGIRQELEEIPATREYPGLRARAFGGGGEGPLNTLKDFFGMRLDPLLGAVAGAPRNPFTSLPNTVAGRIKQYLFRQGVPFHPLLEGKGGLAGARYGNEVADYQKAKERNK